ncbi:ImpA family type VI secretion system protein [Cognatiyoonia sp. IB215182]|uniref:type VI secretion system protein TssA n=1 Tax=Cognatiyoonia sp. IB215182 TaxID=3097353 RepID=UPI002A11EFEC|nr:type VI secretion system ImpA family N-terminal domain-containing protein [Cognatiyoonia sp. IB215182]MDX8355169.1 type VI secretion system ImpA family N-terminal domain-containing protein [Cognatiyoonia sp. IB215182]
MNHLEEPIPGDLPFGIYLKGDRATYRGLRNLFNASQAAWRSYSETPESLQNEELEGANTTAWMALSEACEKCLIETSKDLEILSWFVAAQLHGARPLPKTAEAMAVLTNLVEKSVADMQPAPPPEKLKADTDEGRAAEIAELRLRPFIQLFGEVEGSGLLNAPITNLPLLGEVTYGRAISAEKDGAMDPLRAEAAEVIGAQAETFTQLVEALQELEKLIPRLDAAVKTYANAHGQTPPLIGYGTRLVSDVLRVCQLLVEGLGFPWPGEEEEAAAETEDDGEAGADDAPTGGAPVRKGGGGFSLNADVGNRHEALMAIAQLAKYFRQTEPHSPICLLLDRAVRWGNLSAAELYREILTEGSVGMSQMALMTGLESQGFSDNFGRRGASPAGGVEHPTLDNYAAAVPAPSKTPAPAASPAPSQPQAATSAPSEAAPEPVAEADPESTTDPEDDLPMEDFKW